MKQIKQRYLAWLTILTYFLVVPLPLWNAGKIILCYTEDSHIKIELVTEQGCCNPLGVPSNGLTTCFQFDPAPNKNECTCQICIPISINRDGNTFYTNNASRKLTIHNDINFINQALPENNSIKPSFLPTTTIQISSIQKALRTVILLI
jgi:hypothetical protein